MACSSSRLGSECYLPNNRVGVGPPGTILHSPPIAANTPVLALTKAKRMHTIGNGFATNAPEAAYFCVSDLSWRDGRLEV